MYQIAHILTRNVHLLLVTMVLASLALAAPSVTVPQAHQSLKSTGAQTTLELSSGPRTGTETADSNTDESAALNGPTPSLEPQTASNEATSATATLPLPSAAPVTPAPLPVCTTCGVTDCTDYCTPATPGKTSIEPNPACGCGSYGGATQPARMCPMLACMNTAN